MNAQKSNIAQPEKESFRIASACFNAINAIAAHEHALS
jgi:hypothetical protein